MKAQEWTFVDKSAWGPGPWQAEPDKTQWQDKATSLPCLAVRQPRGGHWCGYVGVTPGHPYYERFYKNCEVRVHGGLTFSDKCQEGIEHGICHIAEPGEEEHIWWLGFDCAHDRQPGTESIFKASGIEALFDHLFPPPAEDLDYNYRTLNYVKAQCAALAAQLSNL